jgi:hypothetical protein
MFREQLEQSGFLQLLPGLFSRFTQALQAGTATGDVSAGHHIPQQGVGLLQLKKWLDMLLGPSFLSTHAAGPALVEPTLRFAHASVQYVSRALQQVGRQDWMVNWLRHAWNTAASAAVAAHDCLHRVYDSQASIGSGAHRASSSYAARRSEISAGGVSVSCAEPAVQWLCLMALAQTLDTWVAKHTRHAADSSSAQQWAAVAALAASMPPAYSNMADQLGCSRELVLLFTSVVPHQHVSDLYAQQRIDPIFLCLEHAVSFKHSQHVGLMMALPAVVLQWLSDMPPRQLVNKAKQCVSVACYFALQAFQDANTLAARNSSRSRSRRSSSSSMQATLEANVALQSRSLLSRHICRSFACPCCRSCWLCGAP